MNCIKFFKENADNKERCKLLQEVSVDVQISWEAQSASEYSPGPVDDKEEVCRQVLNPTHFDPVNGTIRPTFFDDASDKGASVNRLNYKQVEVLRREAQCRVDKVNENPPSTGVRELIGYATVMVEDVRKIFADNPPRRALGVFDTAKPDDESHADICQLVSGKRLGKSVRAQLFQIAKTRLVQFNAR